MVRRIAAAATAVVLAAGVAVAVQLTATTAPAQAQGLQPWNDCDALLEHNRAAMARSATPWGFGHDRTYAETTMLSLTSDSASAAATGNGAGDVAPAIGAGEGGTNVQEAGVDEPDRVKLRDGRLIVVADSRLQLLRTGAPATHLGSLDLGRHHDDNSYTPFGGELLVVGDRALLVTQGGRPAGGTGDPSVAGSVLPVPGHDPSEGRVVRTTELLLIDISTDRPRLMERSTIDGGYLSARLVEGTVRLVTSSSPVVEPLYSTAGRKDEGVALAENRRRAHALTLAEVLPQVHRTAADGTVLDDGPAVECSDVAHPEQPTGTSTLLVTTLEPTVGLETVDSTGVTAEGDLVYASAERLYVATSRWGTVGPVGPAVTTDRFGREGGEVTTEVHAFDTSAPGDTRYVGSGSVPGYLLNRWALSHHEGALRVATTQQPPWDPRDPRDRRGDDSSSMVVKLAERDGRLVETGRVDGLGVTEQIHAVRYLGDLAAVVTFRQTDPLYLIDLSGQPRLLGELKIPGFSAYLHPVGDGRLLGIGYDADPRTGQTKGMQVSSFDVSDPSRPTRVDTLTLDDGHVNVVEDARTFSYDPERRRAMFSFSSYDAPGTYALGVTVLADGTLSETARIQLDPHEHSIRVLTDDRGVHVVSDRRVTTAELDTMAELDDVSLLAD